MSFFLFWLIGIFGPLLAMKAGLTALEKTRDWITIKAVAATFSASPAAETKVWVYLREFPVAPLAAGIFCAWAAACLMGLAACASAGFPQGQAYGFWAEWSRAACLILAAVILYFPDIKLCMVKAAVTSGNLIRAAAVLIAAFVILWLPEHWREIAGYAFLLHAFFLVDRHRDCPDCDKAKSEVLSNPKPWLLLGLLGLCGTVAALGEVSRLLTAILARESLCAFYGVGLGIISLLARLGLNARSNPLAQSPT